MAEERVLSPFAQRVIRFGVVGVAVVGLIAGGVYLFGRSDTEAPASAAVSEPARPARTAQKPANADDDPVVPSEAASDRALRLVGQARRLADDGKFDEAKARLDDADKAVPGLGETTEARRKIAEMGTPQGQLATQLSRARVAIDSDDEAAAEKALAEAERLQPQAPEIAPLRQALKAAQQKETSRSRQIAGLLTTMRESISRKDIAGADRAFNEAARIDVLDPALDPARVELAQAHEAAREKN
jgi:hypothetical protein